MRPADRRYKESHEWAKQDGALVIVGITDHAVEQLGDLTFLEFRVEAGQEVNAGDHFGEIESVKTVADLYIPISGTVREVNAGLPDALDALQENPFEGGWMLKIEPKDPAELEAMMDTVDYETHVAG